MKILKQLVSETVTAGAVGANAIAGFRGSLFAPLKSRKKEKTPKFQVIRFSQKPGFIKEDPDKFDQADVISKLKASEKRNELGRDAIAFGMENEDGQIIKVYVRAEQADDFENALARALGKEDEDENETNSAMEIAEVLFKLRDKFDIIDVEWPEIQGDEEEEGEAELGTEPAEGEPVEGEPTEGEPVVPETEPEDKEDVKSALDKVIDMLKANAEAQRAEADAKKAEADAKQAEYNAKAAEAKVKQEEEVLDMEDYYKQKTEQDKEAKQLAKLAKWKHDMAKEAGEEVSKEETPAVSEDEEEALKIGSTPKTISREKFIDYLRAQIKAQK